MKISFDFDSTLSTRKMQSIADDFISRGHEVHIVTSRFDKNNTVIYTNEDLFKIADKVGISRENITFTNQNDKVGYLEGFDIHFDDDEYEIDLITRSKIRCLGILINYKNYNLKE